MPPVVTIVPVLLHHSEPADPTLLAWIRDRIDAILGLGPAAIVLILGALIVAFPVALGVRVVLQRRRR
ncbi:MAG: hypothetical protein OXP69_11830 [Spirochaetaceae bacterium]|nr:hypothetical protein [Spirochaetaceae bacterium]